MLKTEDQTKLTEKSNSNFRAIVLPLLLIVIGCLYPSNGLDDTINKLPASFLQPMFMLLCISISIYLCYEIMQKIKQKI